MKKILALVALFVTVQTFSQDGIFGADRSITYAVRYISQNISVKDTLQISVSDKPWHRQPDQQFEMIINYQLDGTDTSTFRNLPSIGWVVADTTGAVDSAESCWFHPPRHNQFTSLEMAPFPRVEFPLEAGKTFQSSIFIGEGWGELSNLMFRWNYTIENKTHGFWNISAEAILDGEESAKSELHFTYDEVSGFGDLFYIFSDGTSISFQVVPENQ